jgi:phosphate starvation-inducible protein PhoH and related proteins
MSNKTRRLEELEALYNPSGNGHVESPRITDEDFKGNRRQLKAQTPNQADYIDAIDNNLVIFCLGIAGTGKTYIAVAKAVLLLLEGRFSKIIISRPVVECGENLGFLPGDVDEKIEPYLRPIKDVLNKFLTEQELSEFIAKDKIEFCPLAYMRGRTLDNTILILDEAQNATREQLIMFLTRMGKDSKTIVSGDTTQCDLGFNHQKEALSGLVEEIGREPYIDSIAVVKLTKADIRRNQIIQKIIERVGEK